MSGPSVDAYIAAIDACSSTEQLFSLYRREIEREGFDNVVFVRQDGAQIVEIPYLSVPDGALEVYLEENLAETDPMVRLVNARTPAFTWTEMARRCTSKAERDTLGICREIGCTGGYAMPFYGPHGVSDVFDITFRKTNTLNVGRLKQLSMKTYGTWLRFHELDSVDTGRHIIGNDTAASRSAQKGSALRHHRDGHECISADECRALVICAIALRRYKAGLTELNDGLLQTLGADIFYRLRSRRLLLDLPDDDHMRYYYSPSPVAVAHLKRCAHAAEVSEDAWRLHVRDTERPSDWF
jgi:Autoinducer binding domain